jgi:hypothetical protein
LWRRPRPKLGCGAKERRRRRSAGCILLFLVKNVLENVSMEPSLLGLLFSNVKRSTIYALHLLLLRIDTISINIDHTPLIK